jgi:hypothetical protein
MSQLGQSRAIGPFWPMSAFPRLAIELRTSREVRFVPKTDMTKMRRGPPTKATPATGRSRGPTKIDEPI